MTNDERARRMRGPTKAETRTASELVRVKPPRGEPTARAMEAVALVRSGMDRGEVAKKLGAHRETVNKWMLEDRQRGSAR